MLSSFCSMESYGRTHGCFFKEQRHARYSWFVLDEKAATWTLVTNAISSVSGKSSGQALLESEQPSLFCFYPMPMRGLPGACWGRAGGCWENAGGRVGGRVPGNGQGLSAVPEGLTIHWCPGRAGTKKTTQGDPSSPPSLPGDSG